jgi:thioredoxin-dependent peroxiredoxin
MRTVTFKDGDTIISEGAEGNTAFLIVSGSVEVSVHHGSTEKILATLNAGEVFGEMCLIEPGPRSATVRALTDTECLATSYDEFIASLHDDPQLAIHFTKTLVRRLRLMNERIASLDPDKHGLLQRIQQSLQVILAGLEERDALSGEDTEDLRRDLRMLLQRERMQIASSEIDKAEEILGYMLRPSIQDCLNLWFGKSEQIDQEIWNQFGADVALATRGHYDHWALDVEHPRLLVALVILLDQFPRNMYRDTPQMYACDARCRALVKRGLRIDVSGHLRPIERVFLCLALTHSEELDDQYLCMEEWDRAMVELASDDPLNVFHEMFHRHVAVIKRFGRFPHRNELLQRTNTHAEEEFLEDSAFRFDLPLIRQSDGTFVFAGTVKKRTVTLLGHEYQTLLPDADEAPQGGFEFKYAGPEKVFTKAHEQLKKQGYIRIGDNIPDFTAESSIGPIRFHEFIGESWCVLFSHPADFTPVCTTELGTTAKLQPEWSKRGVKVIGLSVNSVADHERWIADINETQSTQVDFPIIADEDRQVSMLFGMLDATNFRHGSSLGETMTVRNVFIISPSKRVELILSYPTYVGRSFDEILRVVDALQLSAKYRVATPVNWQPGDDTVVLPFISDEEAERMFSDQGGLRKVRSYLRYVRDPSLRRL